MHKSDDTLARLRFDLNLLRFLQALLDTASITRAGEAMSMSQPAASRATARLRQWFGDPLLVRATSGYVLTPLAEGLAPKIRRALSATEEVFEAANFLPLSSQRCFRWASTDYGMSAVLSRALPLLRREAPFTRMQIDPWTDETLSGLQRGLLDCALYSNEPIPSEFHTRKLFADRYALVCRVGHPLQSVQGCSAGMLLDAALEYPQYTPRYLSNRIYVTDNIYSTLGLPGPRVTLEAPYFYADPRAVLVGDMVAVLPERAAVSWANLTGFAVLPLDEPRLSFEYHLIWHERTHRDPGLRWLRDLVVRSLVSPAAGSNP